MQNIPRKNKCKTQPAFHFSGVPADCAYAPPAVGCLPKETLNNPNADYSVLTTTLAILQYFKEIRKIAGKY